MERIQFESRQTIDTDIKMLALAKSDRRCCHCGCWFNYKHKFTIEHVIPLSKGGKNNLSNLVALCEDCNKKKGDNVILPTDYFHYLLPAYMMELMENQKDYYDEVNWLTPQNFFKEDKITISIPFQFDGHRSKKKKNADVEMKFVLEKAEYKDLDEIYDLLHIYNEKYGIEQTDEEMYDLVSGQFDDGVFYIVRNKNKELILVMPLLLRNYQNLNGSLGVIVYMNGFITRYQNFIHRLLSMHVLDEFFSSLSDIPIKYTNNIGYITAGLPQQDIFALDILTQGSHKQRPKEEDGFEQMMVSFKLKKENVKENTRKRGVSDCAQYTVAFKKYLEKNGYRLPEESIAIAEANTQLENLA